MRMKAPIQNTLIVLLSLLSLGMSSSTFAQIPIPGAQVKDELFDYVALGYVLNKFKDVDVPIIGTEGGGSTTLVARTSHPYGVVGVLGTYLGENAHTEVRFGYGVRDDTIQEALTVNVKYWMAWYMGLHTQVSEYSKWFVKIGVSHFKAKTVRREFNFEDPNPPIGQSGEFRAEPDVSRMEDGLFGNSFDISWLVGFDLRIFEDWFLQFEYGNLISDSTSNIHVNQAAMLLRYEY